MRLRKSHGRIHLGPVLGSLVVAINLLVTGCVWHPDYVHPSPHAQNMNPIREAVLKKIPFSITRTFQDGTLLAEFEWEAKGRADWFDQFGFGTTATYWRFVLFGPDGSIICGNVWEPSSVITRKCPLKPEHVGAALSADIDYTYADKLPGDTDFYMSVGRVFYFLDRNKGTSEAPAHMSKD